MARPVSRIRRFAGLLFSALMAVGMIGVSGPPAAGACQMVCVGAAIGC